MWCFYINEAKTFWLLSDHSGFTVLFFFSTGVTMSPDKLDEWHKNLRQITDLPDVDVWAIEWGTDEMFMDPE